MLFLFISNFIFADQLSYITQKQAADAVELLKNYDVIFMYCGCCDDDEGEYVLINDVTMRHTGYEDYYEVVIEKESSMGFVPIDLAYVWIPVGEYALTIGTVLDLEHDPCVEELWWQFEMEEDEDWSINPWLGTWKFIFEEFDYEFLLTVDSLYCNTLNLCTYRVEGEDGTFYTLKLLALEKENRLEFYFWDYGLGNYYSEDEFEKDKPVMELVTEGDAVITNWYQLFGEENGYVCFEKVN